MIGNVNEPLSRSCFVRRRSEDADVDAPDEEEEGRVERRSVKLDSKLLMRTIIEDSQRVRSCRLGTLEKRREKPGGENKQQAERREKATESSL